MNCRKNIDATDNESYFQNILMDYGFLGMMAQVSSTVEKSRNVYWTDPMLVFYSVFPNNGSLLYKR
jgi:hypothetical protein